MDSLRHPARRIQVSGPDAPQVSSAFFPGLAFLMRAAILPRPITETNHVHTSPLVPNQAFPSSSPSTPHHTSRPRARLSAEHCPQTGIPTTRCRGPGPHARRSQHRVRAGREAAGTRCRTRWLASLQYPGSNLKCPRWQPGASHRGSAGLLDSLGSDPTGREHRRACADANRLAGRDHGGLEPSLRQVCDERIRRSTSSDQTLS